MNFTPALITSDWNDEWKLLQKLRRRADDAGYWNKRAQTFTTKDTPNAYVTRFLELADIHPGETVFDMGCGTGALAVPLAKRGHKVVAADFSQGMLDRMAQNCEAHNVQGVFPKLMSWEEDWAAHGVRPGMVDVCVASRSIAVQDLEAALLRLNDIARRRVCITLTTGSSPRTDERLLRTLGLDVNIGRDYLYAFNILAKHGLFPELSYIESERHDTFESYEEAFESFARMIDDAGLLHDEQARNAAKENLRVWLEDNLVPNETAGEPDKKGVAQKSLALASPRCVTWAFISWNKA